MAARNQTPCIQCDIKAHYIGKTYFLLNDNRTILCYRHFYQSNRKDYIISGDYQSISEYMKQMKKK